MCCKEVVKIEFSQVILRTNKAYELLISQWLEAFVILLVVFFQITVQRVEARKIVLLKIEVLF